MKNINHNFKEEKPSYEGFLEIRRKAAIHALYITIAIMTFINFSPWSVKDEDTSFLTSKSRIYLRRNGNLESSTNNLHFYDYDADGIAEAYSTGFIIGLGKKSCPDSLQKIYQEAYQLSKFSKKEE